MVWKLFFLFYPSAMCQTYHHTGALYSVQMNQNSKFLNNLEIVWCILVYITHEFLHIFVLTCDITRYYDLVQ